MSLVWISFIQYLIRSQGIDVLLAQPHRRCCCVVVVVCGGGRSGGMKRSTFPRDDVLVQYVSDNGNEKKTNPTHKHTMLAVLTWLQTSSTNTRAPRGIMLICPTLTFQNMTFFTEQRCPGLPDICSSHLAKSLTHTHTQTQTGSDTCQHMIWLWYSLPLLGN